MDQIGKTLRKAPKEVGMAGGIWDGKTLSAYIKQNMRSTWASGKPNECFACSAFGSENPDPSSPTRIQKNNGNLKKVSTADAGPPR
jgi:hypothetical protein